jgi:hypothetical protein
MTGMAEGIRNRKARDAYVRAVGLFFEWLDARSLEDLSATYPSSVGCLAGSDKSSRNAAHFNSASSAGHNACPQVVSEYSTLGGTW